MIGIFSNYRYPNLLKKDFNIKGRFTGSQLYGRENEYVYDIYMPNGVLLTDRYFSNKRDADRFLSNVLHEFRTLTTNGVLNSKKYIDEIRALIEYTVWLNDRNQVDDVSNDSDDSLITI